MKKLKVLILILAMMVVTTGVFTGCQDRYKNLSGALSKDSVVLYLGEESNVDTITLSLHGLNKDDSIDIVPNISQNIADIKIKTDNNTKESEITFTGTSGGIATAQFIHKDSNKVVGTVNVKVVKRVNKISQNIENNAIVSKAGMKVALNSNKIINFDPVDTTEKDITYKLKQNISGVTVQDNGVITFDQLFTGDLELIATVKGTNISTDITLKVLQSLNNSNFNLYYTYTDKFVNLQGLEVLTLVNNRALYKAVDLKVDTNYANDNEIKVKVKSNDITLVSINENDDNIFTLVTGDKKGNTEVTVSAYIVGYEELTKYEFNLPVEIIKVPDVIKVNEQTDKELNYDIFDIYQNNIGQVFNIEIKDIDATNTSYALVVESGINNIIVVDKSNKQLPVNEAMSKDMISITNSEFYVKANNNFTSDNVKLKIVAVGSYGYDSPNNETITTLNLALRKGVTAINFDAPNNVDKTDTTYYLPVDKSKTITFNISQNEYCSKFTVSSSNETLSFDSVINNDESTKISFDILGVSQGETELKVTAQNGISAVIKVVTYFDVQYFSVTAESFLENNDIGSVEYEVIGDNVSYGIQSLKHISIKEGKSVNLFVNKFDKFGLVSNGANLHKVEFETDQTSNLSITYNGILYARRLTDEDLPAVVTCKVYYYTETGIAEKEYSFVCEVYRPIKNITILSNDAATSSLIIYSLSNVENSEFLLYYYKDLMKKQLSYRLLPSTSSHISKVEWEFADETLFNIDKSQDVSISANTKKLNSTISTNLFLKISQFGKTYIKKLPITIIKIDEITNFYNVKYSIDEGKEQSILENANSLNIGEMYIDGRELNNDSKIKLTYSVLPHSVTFDDVMYYYVDNNPEINTAAISINNDNSLSILRSGTGKLYLIPKTKFQENDIITNQILETSFYINIKIADGLSEDTAFELSNVEDLIKMNNDESLKEFRYYILMNDIDVSRVSNWEAIGSNSLLGFRGQLISQYTVSKTGEKIIPTSYTIKGINLINTLIESGETYGFFSKIYDESLIKSVNFEIEKINVNMNILASTQNLYSYLGGIAGINENSSIINCNVIIKNSNIQFSQATNNFTASIGGIFGLNNGIISNCYVNGDLNVDLNSTAIIIAHIGGLVGINEGSIFGNFTNKQNQTESINRLPDLFGSNNVINSIVSIDVNNLKNNDSSFGGISGTNNGTVIGQVAEFKANVVSSSSATYSNSNIGGISGINNNQIDDCTSVLTNKKVTTENGIFYDSSMKGVSNIGGIIGINKSGIVKNVVVLVLDISDYYADYSSSISPVLYGEKFVGGIIGYLQDGSLNTGYIKSYFVRNENSNTILDATVNTISTSLDSSNYAGQLTGNNAIVTNCYASNVFVNSNKVDETKNNDLIVLVQPTEIEVTITDNYKIQEDLGLLEYDNSIYNGHKGTDDIVKVITKNNGTEITHNTFINAFSNNNIITYAYGEGIIVNSTGKAILRFTSLLNNSLKQEVSFGIIDNVSQFNFTSDIYKDNIINSNNIAIKSGETKDIYLDLKTNTNMGPVDYFSINENKYQYTVNNLKIKFTTGDDSLFTINNIGWTDNSITLAILDKISIVSKANVSRSTTLTANLIAEIDGQEKVIGTKSYKVEVYYGITDMHISSTQATISQKDFLELEIIVDTDNNSIKKENIDIICELKSNIYNQDVNINNQSTFSEDFINVEELKKENIDNRIYYTAKISVKDSYKNDVELNGIITFIAKYNANGTTSQSDNDNIIDYQNNIDNKLGQEKSIDFNLTIKKQKIENINLSYFANAEIDSQGKFTINEVPTTIAYPGTRGVLKVNIYPKEAFIEEVEVTYATNSPYEIQLSQLLYNKSNGKYLSIKPNAVNINNGIRFTKTYAYINKETSEISEDYDGNLFVGVGIGGQCPEGINYTIKVKTMTNDGSIYENSITLTTTTKPSIMINPVNIENQDSTYYVAKGVDYKFNVNFTKIVDNQNQLDTISFKLDNKELSRSNNDGQISYSNNNVTITQKSVTNIGYNSYSVSYDVVFNTIKYDNNTVLSYGLEALFSKTINNIESIYKSETQINFEVEKYIIRSINIIDEVEDNPVVSVFRIGLGQTKTIKMGFNVEYDETDSDIKGEVDSLTNTFSSYNGIWYAVADASSQVLYSETGDINTNPITDNYFNFSYEQSVFKIYAKTRNPNGNMILSGGFYIQYINGMPQIILKDTQPNILFNKYDEIYNETLKLRAIKKSVDFELNIFDTSGPNNYVPISSIDDLLNDNVVQEGGYYRLTNDLIVTEPWIPLTKEIAVLDGNGYSIYLTKGFNESYFYETDSNGNILTDQEGNKINKSNVNLGLYDTLTENMAVYNLNIVLPYYVKTIDELAINHYNDFSVYNDLTILNLGYIAGVNNGIIYNCDAYSNANIENKSIEDIKQEDIEVNEKINYTKSQINDNDYSNFSTKTQVQTMVNIGGLTGINDRTGYITNSRSHIIARLDRGIVGGLVATNNNVIASSSYSAPDISAKESMIVLSNNPTTEDNSAIAGLVAINSGTIRTSYVKGYKYDLQKYKYVNGYIQSSIVTSGLVSLNSGTISNCYANIPVSGTAQTSGLVYSNSGIIDNCVAMSTLALKHSDHTPFIGTKNSGEEIQNTGTLTNNYYLDNGTTSDYSSNLNDVKGITKVTDVKQSSFPTLTFDNENGMGIWRTSSILRDDNTRLIALSDADDVETGHQIQTNTIVTEGYVKYVWNNLNDNNQIASYIIGSVNDFNAYFKDDDLSNNNFLYKVRFVRDIEFSKSEQPQTYDLTLEKAIIQGNGMNVSNIYLPGDMLSSQTNIIENFGLFSEIKNSTVKDLVMTTEKLYANNSKNVGVLAGTIENSKIVNITIETNNTVIQGINFVGGLAGTIKGSNISLINVQAKINANYTNKADTINNVHLYSSNDSEYQYSYAGALAGRIENIESETENIESKTENIASKIENINIYGDSILLGYYTGGVAGYMGENCTLIYAYVDVNSDAYQQARFIAGGLIGYNKGVINKSQITGTNENYYKGSPIIIGGIVGFNEQVSNTSVSGTSGIITNSFNTLPVINQKTIIAGGFIGVTIGGTVKNVIVNAKITALDRAGGLVGVVATSNIMATSDDKKLDAWFAGYEFSESEDFTVSNIIIYNGGSNSILANNKSEIIVSQSESANISCENVFAENYQIDNETSVKYSEYFTTEHVSAVGSEVLKISISTTAPTLNEFVSTSKNSIKLKYNLN